MAQQPSVYPKSMKRFSVLFVEDDPTVRSSIARAIRCKCRSDGLQIDLVLADGVREAKRLLEGRSFSLILSDVMMLDGNGVDLHRWVSVNHPEYDGRFIFCSGYMEDELKEYIRRSKIPFLSKPFGTEEALEVFKGTLRALDDRIRESTPARPASSDDGPPSRGLPGCKACA